MILYFSGTGNSAYVAEKIGRQAEDETVNLFEKIRSHDFSEIHSDKPWVVVSPTYAWRLPRIVQEWLMKTKLTGCRNIYFVLTCGGNIGNAGVYAKKTVCIKRDAVLWMHTCCYAGKLYCIIYRTRRRGNIGDYTPGG